MYATEELKDFTLGIIVSGKNIIKLHSCTISQNCISKWEIAQSPETL